MTTKREGNLEAPTRHPLDWKSEDFYDEASLHKEMEHNEPDFIASDCQLAAHHIEQGMEEASLKKAVMAHPLALFCKAYGI